MCVYIYIHTYVYIYIYTYLHVYTHLFTVTQTYVDIRIAPSTTTAAEVATMPELVAYGLQLAPPGEQRSPRKVLGLL